jgi:hypothetical protein
VVVTKDVTKKLKAKLSFNFGQDCGVSTIDFRFSGVSMKHSVVNIGSERDRPLNSISLQNAVLCADCDVVSHSRLFNYSAFLRCNWGRNSENTSFEIEEKAG